MTTNFKKVSCAIISIFMFMCCTSLMFIKTDSVQAAGIKVPTLEEKVNIYKTLMKDGIITADDIRDKEVTSAFQQEEEEKAKAHEYYLKYLEHKAQEEEEARKTAALKAQKSTRSHGGCMNYGEPVYVENADGTKTIKVVATAYAPTGNKTATGTVPKTNHTIATDPRIIPSGTHVLINGQEYVAEDTGGAIKGNKIDIFMENESVCNDFGVQQMEIVILD